MLSFRNSLTHSSLSSVISRQPPCPVDHSFKMYEMFLLIQPFLPAPSCSTVPEPALCTQSRFLQGPPATSLPAASPHFCPPHMSKVTQHLLKHTSSRWNFLIRDIQRDNRNQYQAGTTQYWQGERGHDAIQQGQWEKHHEDIGCILTLEDT